MMQFYDYDERRFFRADGAPDEIAARREAGFMRLSALYRERYAKTARLTDEVRDGVSDMQLVDAYRVPFQFSRFVRQHLQAGTFLQSSSGVTVTDLDGNTF